MQLSVTKTFLKLTLNINLNKQWKAFSYMQQNYNQLNWNLLFTDGVKTKCFLTWRMLIWTFRCTNIWNFLASVKSENRKQSKHFTKKPIKVCSVTRSREKLTNALSTQEAWATLVAELLAFHFHTHTNRLQQPHCLQAVLLLEVGDRDKFSGSHLQISANTDLRVVCGYCWPTDIMPALHCSFIVYMDENVQERWENFRQRAGFVRCQQPIVEMLFTWEQHEISKAAAMLCKPPCVDQALRCQGFLAFVHLPDFSHFEQSWGKKKHFFRVCFHVSSFWSPIISGSYRTVRQGSHAICFSQDWFVDWSPVSLLWAKNSPTFRTNGATVAASNVLSFGISSILLLFTVATCRDLIKIIRFQF